MTQETKQLFAWCGCPIRRSHYEAGHLSKSPEDSKLIFLTDGEDSCREVITILDEYKALELVPNCQLQLTVEQDSAKWGESILKYLKCQEGAANITFEQEEEKSLLNYAHIFQPKMKAAEQAHKN